MSLRLTLRGKIAVALGLFGVIVAVIAVAGLLWLRSVGLFTGSGSGRAVEVEIPRGASAADIGRILEQAQVIGSATGFRIAAGMEPGASRIQAGRYELRTGMSARDALAALLEGPLPDEFVSLTVPEGAWLRDFARIVGRDTHISAGEFTSALESGRIRSQYQPKGVDSLEGVLFPSTYHVVERDDAYDVLRRFVNEFDEQVQNLDHSAIEELGYSPYEAVIVASMVELEAKHPEERGKIARVIYNRLEAGNPLGIDATIQYALQERKQDLTQSDLAVDSPYNTRRVAGLPPTPIGAPGLASLRAAFDPPEGDWFFYVVSDCEGHHAFSVTSEQFAADKAVYQALDC